MTFYGFVDNNNKYSRRQFIIIVIRYLLMSSFLAIIIHKLRISLMCRSCLLDDQRRTDDLCAACRLKKVCSKR